MKKINFNRIDDWILQIALCALARKKRISDRDVDDEEGVEEFIDENPNRIPDTDRGNTDEKEPDSMGRSEKAKKQPSDESDRYLKKKKTK